MEVLVSEDQDKEDMRKSLENHNDIININEKKLTSFNNELLISEESYKKMSGIMQNCCATVSRIMYQLEPKNVTKIKSKISYRKLLISKWTKRM